MSYIKSYCRIVPGEVLLNDEIFCQPDKKMYLMKKSKRESFEMNDFFYTLYEYIGINYRKFFKMDALSKLGFLASEILLAGSDREQPKQDMGIILFNRSSSLEADGSFQKTIQNPDDFFPSPAEFVYTLPNIVTGEIAIRNKIYGETVFYVTSRFLGEEISKVINDTMYYAGLKYALAGWVEVDVFKNTLDCLMMLCTAKPEDNSSNYSETYLTDGYLKTIHPAENISVDYSNLINIYK
jgi:hypothetical protein